MKIQQIFILIGLTKISLKTFQLLLTATDLITDIKQENLVILKLKTWLIILKIIKLVKQLLKVLNTLNELKHAVITKQNKINSFIDEFDRATNEEDKEKVVKKLKDINSFIEHYAQMEDDYNENKCKLFDIVNAIDYFLDEYSKE